jgi:hypothetical protein
MSYNSIASIMFALALHFFQARAKSEALFGVEVLASFPTRRSSGSVTAVRKSGVVDHSEHSKPRSTK